MNVLIITADHAEAAGVDILREASAKVWGEPTILYTHGARSGASLSITLPEKMAPGQPHVSSRQLKTDARAYEVDGTPADALYLAMCWPEMIVTAGRGFDYVLTGINQGHNCGLDALHSGTVMTAALAASVFGIPAMAFSQQIKAPRLEEQKPEFSGREWFKTAESLLQKILLEAPKTAGFCQSINFPAGAPKGYKQRVPLALRSRWFPEYIPMRAATPTYDADWLEEGYVVMSDLNLSLAEQIRF